MRQLEDAVTKSSFVKDTRRLEKDDPNYGKPQVGGILEIEKISNKDTEGSVLLIVS